MSICSRGSFLVLSRTGDGVTGLTVRGATSLGLAFVPGLLSLGQCDFTFDLSILEIHSRGDQRVALLLGLGQQLAQFAGVHQQLARAQRRVVGIAGVLISANV